MDERALAFALLCVPLSLLSFGGGQTIVAGLQHQTVDLHQWLTAQQFTQLFAISKTAPGPSTLIVALLGWQIGGVWGAVAAAVAIFLPSSLLLCAVGKVWQQHRGAPLTRAIEKGLLPVAVGLIFAGVLTVARFAELGVIDAAVILATAATLRFTRIGPYPILGVVGLFYLGLSLATQ